MGLLSFISSKFKKGKIYVNAHDSFYSFDNATLPTLPSGEPILNKNGSPVIVGAHPPTVTGLALWLGFKTRQSLLNYQHRTAAFNDILTVAKSRCEEYAERRLFDRDGVNGAKFSLANNFKGVEREARSVFGEVRKGAAAALQRANGGGRR